MSTDDRSLREAWRERAGSDPVGCPDADAILRAATGASNAGEFNAIAEHAMRCPACAEAWRLARALAAGERVAAREVRERTAWRTPLLAAAALVVAVAGLGLVMLRAPERGDQALRDAAPETLRSTLQDGAALPRDRFVLTWSPGPPGTVYDVEVGTPQLEILIRGRALDVTTFLVPREALEGIPDGGVVAWRVEATWPDGRRISSITHLNQVR